MRLEDCETNVDLVQSAEFRWTRPEPDWTEAHENGILPNSLMKLYARARFLSFGAAPPFLRDERKRLFSYFCLMFRGVKESLVDANDDLESFALAESKVWDRGKELRGEAWSPAAALESRRHFRLVLLSLCAALDSVAEICALLFQGAVPNLKVGRAEFVKIEDWVETDLADLPAVASPLQVRTAELHAELRPLIIRENDAKDWLPLLRLYRNKAAHLGGSQLREVGFANADRVFYTFLPTRWPVLWEEHMKEAGSSQDKPVTPLTELLGPLMHQDKISYAYALRKEVTRLLEAVFLVADRAYRDFHDLPASSESIQAVDKAVKEFAFRAFD